MRFGGEVETTDARGRSMVVALEEGVVSLDTAFDGIEVELAVLEAAIDKLRAGSGSTPGVVS